MKLMKISGAFMTFMTFMSGAQSPSAPHLFLLDDGHLAAVRERVAASDPALMPAWSALREQADKALALSRFSVVDKAVTPPSGDKHDYTSQAPYWWPNPATPNGLPYIRKDGERNPELDRISDHRASDGMVSAVETLALAAYLGGDERHARKAIDLVRAWFLDPATRMNPNLEYAQFIPGVNSGRGIGIIETRSWARLMDALALLETSPAWTTDTGRGVRDWFSRFLAWMQQSQHGRDESAAKNNHGTYYDLQVACFALYLGQPAVAREVVETAKQKRIAVQIEPDGRQPLELARTNSWGYSTMNLDGLTALATVGDRVGVDLWHYRTADGRSIRAALLYLAPFALDGRKWPHEQISAFRADALFASLRRAAPQYDDAEFAAAVAKVPKVAASDRSVLTSRGR